MKKHWLILLLILIIFSVLALFAWRNWFPSPMEPSYRFIQSWGERGNSPGQFEYPEKNGFLSLIPVTIGYRFLIRTAGSFKHLARRERSLGSSIIPCTFLFMATNFTWLNI